MISITRTLHCYGNKAHPVPRYSVKLQTAAVLFHSFNCAVRAGHPSITALRTNGCRFQLRSSGRTFRKTACRHRARYCVSEMRVVINCRGCRTQHCAAGIRINTCYCPPVVVCNSLLVVFNNSAYLRVVRGHLRVVSRMRTKYTENETAVYCACPHTVYCIPEFTLRSLSAVPMTPRTKIQLHCGYTVNAGRIRKHSAKYTVAY